MLVPQTSSIDQVLTDSPSEYFVRVLVVYVADIAQRDEKLKRVGTIRFSNPAFNLIFELLLPFLPVAVGLLEVSAQRFEQHSPCETKFFLVSPKYRLVRLQIHICA